MFKHPRLVAVIMVVVAGVSFLAGAISTEPVTQHDHADCESCPLPATLADANQPRDSAVLSDQPNATSEAVASQLAFGQSSQTSAFTLFDTSDFPPRWECGQFSSVHGWTHIVADVLIFAAYMAIPIVLVYFIRKRPDMPFPKVIWLFGAFILACGLGHLMEATIFYWPAYRVSALIKSGTAVASWATVFALIPIVPIAMRFPALAQINQQLESEITERRRAEHQVEHFNNELRRRNEEMEQFVYTVSHDLKSPIVTCLGFLDCLEEDITRGDQAQMQDSMERLKRANHRMEQSINDLLEFSRIGRIRHEPVKVETTDVIEKLVAELGPRFEQKNAKVIIEPDMPAVVADPVRFAEVIENLLTNAIKYGCSNDQPTISIGSKQTADSQLIFVADNGEGIASEHHQKIFELFQRLDGDKTQGTGVGLAIVTRIMETHGGRVWVDSNAGHGATFWLEFPRESSIDQTETQTHQG